MIVGLGIAPQRYSRRLLCECREFVVNLPTAAILDKVLACGNVSGRDVRDKLAMAGLTPASSSRTATSSWRLRQDIVGKIEARLSQGHCHLLLARRLALQ